MQNHEYALVGGMNRANIGRYITLIASSVSAGIVFVLLSAVDLAHRWGWNVNLTPGVLSLVGATAVFGALYWFFNRFAWRWPPLSAAIKVPNLAGEWACSGQTINPDGTPSQAWQANITILQSWDKIRVRLRTAQSGSDSIAAALICDDDEGFRLLYNYRNTPKIGEVGLKAHLGFCELVFDKLLRTAEGEYFNGHGRFTFGTMKLARK
jgi:SMODS-associating 2TM, beta-strand rich effector domain